MKGPSETSVHKLRVIMPAQLGFHLRIVARFVSCAKQFQSDIRVRKGKLSADGKSITGLLLLAAAWKSKLRIEAEGYDSKEAIESIKAFFKTEKT